jgi:hypothetical protein
MRREEFGEGRDRRGCGVDPRIGLRGRVFNRALMRVPDEGLGWSGGGGRGGDGGGENSPGPRVGPPRRSPVLSSLSVPLSRLPTVLAARDPVSARRPGTPVARRCVTASDTDGAGDRPRCANTPLTPAGTRVTDSPRTTIPPPFPPRGRSHERPGPGRWRGLPPLPCWSGPITRGLYPGSGPPLPGRVTPRCPSRVRRATHT